MAFFLAVPPKKASEVDLVKPLKSVIAAAYSTTSGDASSSPAHNFDDAIESLNKMRKECTNKGQEFKHESALATLEKYYDQLLSLEAKCPPSEIQIPFKWKDSMMAASFLGTNSLTIPSLGYERMCILYNIAAAQSQIATAQVNESLTNDIGLKMAAKYFCSASGIFQALKHLVPAAVPGQDLTVDLNPDVLQVLYLLMLAQAQEAFFHKACNDNMKDAVVAKIAAQVEDFYNETYKHMQVKFSWPDKEWMPIIQAKQLAFKGIAEYYQGVVCGQSQDFGEQLSRLTKALELLKQAESKGPNVFPSAYKEYIRKATRVYEDAKKDNEFIYHARIPDYSSLNPVGKAALAKPTSVPEKFRPEQPDLFEKLLPVSMQQSLVKIEARKQEVVNGEIAAIRELNQVLNTTLTSLNLPAAIEDTSGVQLPPSLLQKAEAIKTRGGLGALEGQLAELPDLLQRNKEILDETERLINDEEQSDKNLREQFKQRWTRVPSEKLTGAWKDNIAKYRTIIQNAIEADNKVKAKFETHRSRIRLLTSPQHELTKAIPTGSTGSDSNSEPVTRLRRLMNQVEALKNEREVIESELKSTPFDTMKSEFLRALAADGALNEAALSIELVGKVYGPLQKQVRDSRARQEALIKEVQEAKQEFDRLKGPVSGQNAAREQFLADLAAGHDAYFELSSNVSIIQYVLEIFLTFLCSHYSCKKEPNSTTT